MQANSFGSFKDAIFDSVKLRHLASIQVNTRDVPTLRQGGGKVAQTGKGEGALFKYTKNDFL